MNSWFSELILFLQGLRVALATAFCHILRLQICGDDEDASLFTPEELKVCSWRILCNLAWEACEWHGRPNWTLTPWSAAGCLQLYHPQLWSTAAGLTVLRVSQVHHPLHGPGVHMARAVFGAAATPPAACPSLLLVATLLHVSSLHPVLCILSSATWSRSLANS